MSSFLNASLAWNVGDILDGDEASLDITVTGAALGDFVDVSASLDTLDLVLSAKVTAANTVTVSLSNTTGGTVDALTPTMRVRVTTLSGLHLA